MRVSLILYCDLTGVLHDTGTRIIIFTELPPPSTDVHLVRLVQRLYDEQGRGRHSYGEVDRVVVNPCDALK